MRSKTAGLHAFGAVLFVAMSVACGSRPQSHDPGRAAETSRESHPEVAPPQASGAAQAESAHSQGEEAVAAPVRSTADTGEASPTTVAADPPAEPTPPAREPAAPSASPERPKKPAYLPRLVDLGADRCIPCKMMAPVLEELKREYADQFTVEIIDVWKDPTPGRTYRIRVIPTQIFFDASGKELWRHEGFFGKEDILKKWEELGVEIQPPKG